MCKFSYFFTFIIKLKTFKQQQFIMKQFTFNLASIFLVVISSFTAQSQQTVQYTITFTSNWGNSTNTSLPANAHFSDFAVATHNRSVTFFEMGQTASPGVELIAELGATGAFSTEVGNAITAGTADQVIIGPDLFFSDANYPTISIQNITVDKDFPLVSLLSMIAPSPDWFVGANSISLLDTNGDWIPEITMDLFPYDAGTEEGTGYSLDNPATTPLENITNITGMYTFNNQKMGTLIISSPTILSVPEFDETSEILIYQNITKDVTISNFENIDLTTAEVFSMSGNMLKKIDISQPSTSKHLNLDNLASGVYILKINTGNGSSKTQKLVVN